MQLQERECCQQRGETLTVARGHWCLWPGNCLGKAGEWFMLSGGFLEFYVCPGWVVICSFLFFLPSYLLPLCIVESIVEDHSAKASNSLFISLGYSSLIAFSTIMYLYLFLAVNTKKAFIVKLFFLAYIFLNSFSFPEPFFLDIFQGLRGPMCLMEKG